MSQDPPSPVTVMAPTLYWLDLETTGLDPSKDVILEIAVATATLDDPFKLTHVYHRVLAFPHPTWLLGRHLEVYSEFVFETHTRTGLWDECAAAGAAGLAQVVADLLALVPIVEDYSERPTLAGSSIHFDLAFLKRFMPDLAARFSHRLYDVSAVKLFARSLGMKKIPKAEAHRAVADIEESAAHGAAVAAWLTRRP